MPENDFEKQVQQKMDELKFYPSDAVWPAVEKELHEKKRRRIIFWLPLFGILLGGAALMYWGEQKNTGNKNDTAITIDKNETADKKENNSTDNTDKIFEKKKEEGVAKVENDAKAVEQKNIVKDTKPVEAATDKSAALLNKNKASQTVVEDVATNKVSAKKNKKDRLSRKEYSNLAAPTTKAYKKHGNKEKSFDAVAGELAINNKGRRQQKEKSKTSVDAHEESVAEKNNQSEVTKPATIIEEGNTTAKTNLPDTANASMASTKKQLPDSINKQVKADSSTAVAKNKTEKPSSKKISWGLQVKTGASAVSSGFTNLFSGTPSNYDRSVSGNFSSSPISNNNGNLGSTGGPTAIIPPSEIKPGFSFGAGAFISKPLKKNGSLLLGINYNYISTQLTVGPQNIANTAIANLNQYSTGSTSKYTNQFHFIELPISLQKQFSAKSRFSVGGGLLFSWLLSTNTLLYNSQSNTYSKNNSDVNKFQWGLQAGVYYRLFPTSLPIQIGPQFYYAANNIFNKDLYGSRHLLFAGIQANIVLPKKKK